MSPDLLGILRSYLPDLVIRRFIADPTPLVEPESTEFLTAVLLADVSGFTSLAERLAHMGPEGAEELTRVLNGYLGSLIAIIRSHGGDIVKFAGDAMLVLWAGAGPEGDLADLTLRATQCALALQREGGEIEAVPGAKLSLHSAVEAGVMTVSCLGGVFGRWEFVVAGPALATLGSAARQSRSGDVVLAPLAFGIVAPRIVGHPLDEGCVRAEAVAIPIPVRPAAELSLPPAAGSWIRSFVPGAIRSRLDAGQTAWLAELRQVSVLFVNLPDLHFKTPLDQAQQLMHALQEAVYRFEGSINKLSIDEKGISLVAVYGLPPLAHPDDPARAVGAALAILEGFAALGIRCSIGISTGRTFCGEVGSAWRREYTVMGDVVNLAARLMGAASDGIRCDAPTANGAARHYEFESLPAISIKGKTGLFEIYRPLGKRERRIAARVTLVGREREKEHISGLLRRLAAGAAERGKVAGRLVVVEGEAGMGKTALLEYALETARTTGIRCLAGGGGTLERNSPFQAWQAVFSDLLGLVPGDDQEASRSKILAYLAAIAEEPDWLPLIGSPLALGFSENGLTAPLEPQERAKLTRDVLLRLLRGAATRQPLLILLDDGQWLDSASWELANAAAEIEGCGLLIAMRPLPGGAPSRAAEIVAAAGEHRVVLGPLTGTECLELACSRLGVRDLPEPVAHLLEVRAGGHPLFVEELAVALRNAGVLVVEDGACRLDPAARGLSEIQLPSSIEALITSRIDRLPPETQLTLKVSSVIGTELDAHTVEAVHPIQEQRGDVPLHLGLLAQSEILTGEPERESYAFRSASIRDAAYSLMLHAQRREIHRAIAELYEETCAADLDRLQALLAYHWSRAGEPANALPYLEAAGRQAERLFAYREAAILFEEALACTRRLPDPDPERQAHLEYWLGTVYKGMGRQAESQSRLDAAIEGARRLGDRLLEGQALISLAQLHSIQGNGDRALELFAQADAATRESGDVRERLRCLHLVSRLQYRAGRAMQAIETCHAAVSLAEAAGETGRALPLAQSFLGMLHVSCAVPGLGAEDRIRQGLDWLRQAVEALRNAGDRLALNDALNLLGNARWIAGDYPAALVTFEESLCLTTALGLDHDEICARINVAIQYHEMECYPEMERHAATACSKARGGGYQDYAAISAMLGAVALARLGQPGSAAERHSLACAALDSLPPSARGGLDLTVLPYFAEYLMLAGDLAGAEDAASRALAAMDATGVREYERRVLALLEEIARSVARPTTSSC